MVSELVSNAVEHAPPQLGGWLTIRLEVDEKVLRVVVVDGGPELSLEGPKADYKRSEVGYGLGIVNSLADRWGLSLDGDKAVWLEVDREK